MSKIDERANEIYMKGGMTLMQAYDQARNELAFDGLPEEFVKLFTKGEKNG